MAATRVKESLSLKLNASIIEQIKADARSDNKSVSDYLEMLLYRMGYRPDNEETLRACQDAREGRSAGVVDTTSLATIEASLMSDDLTEEGRVYYTLQERLQEI